MLNVPPAVASRSIPRSATMATLRRSPGCCAGSTSGGPEPTASEPCSPAPHPRPRSSPHSPARRCPATSRAAGAGRMPGSRQRQARSSSVSAVASLLHIGHYGVARRVAADLTLRDQGRLGGLPGLSPYVRAAPNPRALTGRFGPHLTSSGLPFRLSSGFPSSALRFFPLRPPSSGFPSAGVLWLLPFGRHCPVPFPFGFPPGSLPLEQPRR